ncbi:uncharacterized protein LOC111399980 [Olea europaea var. sylvestris]|uniref:uncharacterized protein LOC111399980 n=1 Tax=Olea europaea var. sylvestris TaxID=158386 RepID=UPI000C1CF709|nr:uncharacterized protein LOC111399980 [Olea europaea var. sylvestris]
MKAYLKAYDLWEIAETGMEPPPLRVNPTIAQLKQHSEEAAKKFKALSCIQSVVSDAIFTRIITCEMAKKAWDRLQEEFRGNARTRQMQVLNLRREYESLKMKEAKTVKEFSDRLMKVVNKIRLLGDDLPDRRIVEKVLISLPEKFEAKISSLEDSRDLSTITLSKLVNALHATEQRRLLRQEEQVEGALFAKGKYKAPANSGVKKPGPERKKGEGSKFVEKTMCKTQKERQEKQQAQLADDQLQPQEEHLFTANNFLACSNDKT